jgi:hypothetical protein
VIRRLHRAWVTNAGSPPTPAVPIAANATVPNSVRSGLAVREPQPDARAGQVAWHAPLAALRSGGCIDDRGVARERRPAAPNSAIMRPRTRLSIAAAPRLMAGAAATAQQAEPRPPKYPPL